MGKGSKEDEKIERTIRSLLKIPENKRCINCNSLGPQYVCTTFMTFVCTNCSGVHREFTHRVKSMSMAKFNAEEVSALQAGGNERVRQIYFKDWDPQYHSYPDASANVFGVSTESMQLSFDARGNSVPTILILMQRHLYAQGGLQAEGIFRINAENSQEEHVRDQLNRGVIPEGVDVHCLAGLIKAWFRELPTAVLDSLTPEQVMQSQSEEECAELVRLLPPTEAALLDWAVNLMADVAQMEHFNKMNARNIAMVFAPNMTHMVDPLTALMYAVQVMNFLKTLIVKTLKEREESLVETAPVPRLEPSDEDEHQSTFQPYHKEANEEANKENEEEGVFVGEEPDLESPLHSTQNDPTTESGSQTFLSSIKNIIPGGNRFLADNCPCEVVSQVSSLANGPQEQGLTGSGRESQPNVRKIKSGQSSGSNLKKGPKKVNEQLLIQTAVTADKSKRSGILSRINSRTELAEGWR